MRCQSCGFDNRTGRRFCAECGTELAVACAHCGFANEPEARFCGGCGTRLGAAADAPPLPAPEPMAERRQISVLFCDLVGSTALARTLDPEDARTVIHDFQRACAETVARYEGFVARYMGDGVLAYFGYPQAHEDDAERAVRAALDILDTVGRTSAGEAAPALAARAGIATGLVVVGDLIGEGAAEERTAIGETPNLAARLQAVAAPGTLVVGERTRRLLGRRFEVEPLATVVLKGFPEPVAAWRVIRDSTLASRFEALREPELTPFVGRDHELTLLLDTWRRAASGRGQVVLITGEAGIGKSRLTLALRQAIAGTPHATLTFQCSPYRRNSVLHPVAEALRNAAGIDLRAPDEVRLDALLRYLAAFGPARDADAPLLAALLSIPSGGRLPALALGPERRKEETLRALIGWVAALPGEQPLLVVLEDAHWIDATTLAFLDHLVDRAAAAPMALLVTARPEFSPSWVGLAHVRMIALNRLDERNSATVATHVALDKALPESILREIVERTDGVPLFVEELTKTVLESGLLVEAGDRYALAGPLPPLAIPATLQDSLMARLDQLASVKNVAQIGAVIGREFTHELIAQVADLGDVELAEALGRLVADGLVSRRGEPPRASYIFKHALIRDAAYESLLKSRRHEIHARLVRVLEERFPETAETEPEVLARHCTEAGLTAKAVDYRRRAGERALKGGATIEAVSHFQRGIELIAGLPDTPQRARQEVALRLQLASTLRVLDRIGDALVHLDLAERVAAERDLDAERSRICHCRGNLHFALANGDASLAEHAQALSFARKAASAYDEAHALGGLGDAHYVDGKMRTAHAYFRECVDFARAEGFSDVEAANLHMLGWTGVWLNDLDEAARCTREGLEKAIAVSDLRSELLSHTSLVFIELEQADFATARRELDAAIELALRLGARTFEAQDRTFLAQVLFAEGETEGALSTAREALALMRRSNMRFFGPFTLGTLALITPDPAERGGALAEAEVILADGCVAHNHFWLRRDAIELSLRLQDWAAAERHAAALDAFCRREPLPWSDFLVARGRALAAFGRGRRDDALQRQLQALHAEARRAGLHRAAEALAAALEDA